ncbi:Uncharacterised protein [Mycobacterium tuberculosis]|uniref:Uncharacterized protein n=1 Tax=Mycobacterium tuberculosis TaxID=1773 RepID=A0A655A2B9_MYCTX|nr:Uncharacterised protein [Mycobacterium tuberculosis]
MYQPKNRSQCTRAASIDSNRFGKSGRYLRVLNWASDNGLSLLVCGRECDLVTPRSASSSATGLELIDEPRSACRVSWSALMCWAARVCAISRSAKTFDSREATIHPTT